MSPFIRPTTVQPGDRILARGVFLLLLAVYTATFVGLPDNPDAEVEFQTTSSLVREFDLALGGTPEAEALLAHRAGNQAGFNVREGVGDNQGRYYSWFGVGQALVGVPFYLAGQTVSGLFPKIEERHRSTRHYGVARSEYFEHLFVGWRNPLLGAMTAWLIVISARRVGARRLSAFVGGLSYGLCTFAWPQARSTLSDVQATFFLFLALHLAFSVREQIARKISPSPIALVGFGLSLALAFLTRLVTAPAILVVVLFLVIVLVSGRGKLGSRSLVARDLALALTPALAGLGVFLWINQMRFGHPLESGYGAAVNRAFFSYPPHRGLAGLLLSPGKGLFWLAPAVLLAVFGGLRLVARGDRSLPWLLLFFGTAVFLPILPAQTWHGAWTYGPRYILPVLPVLWLLVAVGMDALPSFHYGRTLAGVLLVLGLLTNVPGALVDHMTHQDLALQAARTAWPNVEGEDARAQDDARFDMIQWDWRFAAPWAHWRILRRRLADLGEEFPLSEIFYLESDASVRPAHERDRGFRHLAWIDLRERLGGEVWPGVLISLALAAWGLGAIFSGLDPTLN